jgi:hypothetical protein
VLQISKKICTVRVPMEIIQINSQCCESVGLSPNTSVSDFRQKKTIFQQWYYSKYLPPAASTVMILALLFKGVGGGAVLLPAVIRKKNKEKNHSAPTPSSRDAQDTDLAGYPE